jgi:hypothetical protein
MKYLYAPVSDHVLRPRRGRSGLECAQQALLWPRSAVGFSSGEASAQSLASKVLQALRTAAAVAPLGDPRPPVKGLHKRSSRFERSLPFSSARSIFGSLGTPRIQLYNWSIDADAQVRPCTARTRPVCAGHFQR